MTVSAGRAKGRWSPPRGSGRPLLTPDMARIEPHAVAAAPAEYGFVSSMAVPLETVDGRLGSMQLFGDFWRPVDARLADLIRPLMEVLVARLIDVRTIRSFTQAAHMPAHGRSWCRPRPIPSRSPPSLCPCRRRAARSQPLVDPGTRVRAALPESGGSDRPALPEVVTTRLTLPDIVRAAEIARAT